MNEDQDILEFEVLPEHIKLLSHMHVHWHSPADEEDEVYGAPAIDPVRPYGDSDIFNDVANILGITPVDGSFPQRHMQRMRLLHRDTALVLQIFLQTKRVRPGTYQRESSNADWVYAGAKR